MTIILYKNGQWLIDGEQPLEGVSLDNLAAILTNPSDGDVIKYDEASGLWTAGKALPAVSATDNGKVLAVKDGAWAAQQKKFIVTLTPTSPGYSGTMDKTLAEINAAYEAGQQIVFRVVIDANQYMDVNCTATFSDGLEYPSFNAYIIDGDTDTALYAYTGTTNTGTDNTYSTKVYTLTPAS